MIKTEDIPEDVQLVWAIQITGQPVGLEVFDKINTIIKQYPKYFPWETKYNSIPKEVHDAYYNEKNAEFDKIWQEKREAGYKGLIPTILETYQLPSEPVPSKSLSELVSDAFKRQDEEREAAEERHKKDKALWDKHYKHYGLEYRK